MHREEEEFIHNYFNRDLSHIKEYLADINYPLLTQLLEKEFWDEELQSLFSEILVALFQRDNLTPSLQLQGIRYWINSLKSLSAGANGVTYTSKIRGMLQEQIVVKESANLDHEVFVGLRLNALRKYLTNFSYLYLGFGCSSPIFVEKEFLSWCNREKREINYAFYEFVRPSISFAQFVSSPRVSLEEVRDCYLQTLFALNFAFHKVKFTHFDLHGENILLRELPDEKEVPYPAASGGTYFFSTKRIPTFIDYGFSTVEYLGKIYGSFVNVSLGNVPYFPLYDAYLLAVSLYIVAKREEVKRFFASVIKFFTPLPLEEIVKSKENVLSALPGRSIVRGKEIYKESLDGLISLLLPLSKKVSFSPHSDILEEPISLASLGLENPPYAKTLFELYYLLNQDKDNPEKLREILSSFPPLEIEKKERQFLEEISQLRLLLSPLLNIEFLQLYVDYFKLYKRLKRTLDIFVYLSRYYEINLDLLEELWRAVMPVVIQNKRNLLQACQKKKPYHTQACTLNKYIEE